MNFFLALLAVATMARFCHALPTGFEFGRSALEFLEDELAMQEGIEYYDMSMSMSMSMSFSYSHGNYSTPKVAPTPIAGVAPTTTPKVAPTILSPTPIDIGSPSWSAVSSSCLDLPSIIVESPIHVDSKRDTISLPALEQHLMLMLRQAFPFCSVDDLPVGGRRMLAQESGEWYIGNLTLVENPAKSCLSKKAGNKCFVGELSVTLYGRHTSIYPQIMRILGFINDNLDETMAMEKTSSPTAVQYADQDGGNNSHVGNGRLTGGLRALIAILVIGFVAFVVGFGYRLTRSVQVGGTDQSTMEQKDLDTSTLEDSDSSGPTVNTAVRYGA